MDVDMAVAVTVRSQVGVGRRGTLEQGQDAEEQGQDAEEQGQDVEEQGQDVEEGQLSQYVEGAEQEFDIEGFDMEDTPHTGFEENDEFADIFSEFETTRGGGQAESNASVWSLVSAKSAGLSTACDHLDISSTSDLDACKAKCAAHASCNTINHQGLKCALKKCDVCTPGRCTLNTDYGGFDVYTQLAQGKKTTTTTTTTTTRTSYVEDEQVDAELYTSFYLKAPSNSALSAMSKAGSAGAAGGRGEDGEPVGPTLRFHRETTAAQLLEAAFARGGEDKVSKLVTSTEAAKTAAPAPAGSTAGFVAAIEDLKGSVVLDIGDGDIIHRVWRGTKNVAPMMAIVPVQRAKQLDALDANHYVATYDTSPLPILSRLQKNPQFHVDTLVLSNLSMLVGPNLPHEFEYELGKIFALSRNVVIIEEAQQSKAFLQYFKHWANSLAKLVEGVCEASNIQGCSVTKIHADKTASPRGGVIVRYTNIVRPLSTSVCSTIKGILGEHYSIHGTGGKTSKSCFIESIYTPASPKGTKHTRARHSPPRPPPPPRAKGRHAAGASSHSPGDSRRTVHVGRRLQSTGLLLGPADTAGAGSTKRASHFSRAADDTHAASRGTGVRAAESGAGPLPGTHQIRWKRVGKTDAPLNVELYRPEGFPFHALSTLVLTVPSYTRLGALLFNRGTDALLRPAVQGDDYRGTLTLQKEGLARQHGAANEFMFAGASWSAPAGPRSGGGRRKLRSVPALAAAAVGAGAGADVGATGQRRRLLATHTDKSERHFGSFWASVWDSVSSGDDFDRDAPVSILTYGAELAYVGIKLARQVTLGTLLVVSGHDHTTAAFTAASTLMDELSIEHSLYKRQLNPRIVGELYQLPDVVHYQFLGTETFHLIATLGADFVPYLGKLLSLARVTFICVLPPATIKMIARLLHRDAPHGQAGVFAGMLHQALRSAGVTDFDVSLVDPGDESEDYVPKRVVRVDVFSARREVEVGCGDHTDHDHDRATMTLESEQGEVKLASANGDEEYVLHRAHSFVSLGFVLALGATTPAARAHYFAQYMGMPQQADMCPLHVLVSGTTLHLTDLLKETPQLVAQVAAAGSGAGGATLVNDTVRQLERLLVTPFSLMEHSSGKGNVSMRLAAKFPNDTIISVEENEKKATGHWKHIKANEGPFNNIVCNMKPGVTLMSKLLESPEVLRYQFVGLEHVLSYLTDAKQIAELGETLGTAFGTGVSTFLQLPSTRSLSVAMATLYPGLATKVQRRRILGPEAVPLPGLVDLEKHFIAEITRLTYNAPQLSGKSGVSVPDHAASNLSNHISVRPSLVPPVSVAGHLPSWRLLRVDVRKLEFQVNHHFDYRLDGHDRKYQMHIESNSTTDWRVFLTRRHDKWRIPYKVINSITLIALLRMGLLDEIKKRFYEQFLSMPIYEDMAPWNIVFRGGLLEYIDYDTKDHTLTKILPFAYQIIAALMNYERTVNDFGHCNGHASNEFGISFISHCVRSDFGGPCKESRYPVPCGDYSCRESYPGTRPLTPHHHQPTHPASLLAPLSLGASVCTAAFGACCCCCLPPSSYSSNLVPRARPVFPLRACCFLKRVLPRVFGRAHTRARRSLLAGDERHGNQGQAQKKPDAPHPIGGGFGFGGQAAGGGQPPRHGGGRRRRPRRRHQRMVVRSRRQTLNGPR